MSLSAVQFSLLPEATEEVDKPATDNEADEEQGEGFESAENSHV